MSVPARLLKVGSMAGSLGVYLTAATFQKGMGLLRVLLFTYLMQHTQSEWGLWALGMFIVSFFSPLLCMGSNHGLARYVSYYEAQGRLEEFYRRIRWAVLACCGLLAAAAFVASKPITQLVIATCDKRPEANFDQQLMICWAALANAFLMALYFNMLSFMNGLRVYRMTSATEIFFGAVFALFGAVGLIFSPTGLMLLMAHLAAVALALAAGSVLLHAGVKRLAASGAAEQQPPPTLILEPPFEPEHAPAPEAVRPALGTNGDGAIEGVFRRIMRFGLVAMAGNMLWAVITNLSFWLTSYKYDMTAGSVFHVFWRLSELTLFLSMAAWTVIFTHVARHWEGGRREVAIFNLQTSFKAVALATMTLAVLVHLTGPLWVRILAPKWRGGLQLLPGLLLFFQVIASLGLLNMLTWLRERPVLILATGAAGGGLNLLLALLWLPQHGALGAAWAAGIGMAAGGGCVAVVYFAATRTRFHASTYFVMATPLILLLNLLIPSWAVACIWGAVLAAAVWTGWVFDHRQKALLSALAKRAANVARGRHA